MATNIKNDLDNLFGDDDGTSKQTFTDNFTTYEKKGNYFVEKEEVKKPRRFFSKALKAISVTALAALAFNALSTRTADTSHLDNAQLDSFQKQEQVYEGSFPSATIPVMQLVDQARIKLNGTFLKEVNFLNAFKDLSPEIKKGYLNKMLKDYPAYQELNTYFTEHQLNTKIRHQIMDKMIADNKFNSKDFYDNMDYYKMDIDDEIRGKLFDKSKNFPFNEADGNLIHIKTAHKMNDLSYTNILAGSFVKLGFDEKGELVQSVTNFENATYLSGILQGIKNLVKGQFVKFQHNPEAVPHMYDFTGQYKDPVKLASLVKNPENHIGAYYTQNVPKQTGLIEGLDQKTSDYINAISNNIIFNPGNSTYNIGDLGKALDEAFNKKQEEKYGKVVDKSQEGADIKASILAGLSKITKTTEEMSKGSVTKTELQEALIKGKDGLESVSKEIRAQAENSGIISPAEVKKNEVKPSTPVSTEKTSKVKKVEKDPIGELIAQKTIEQKKQQKKTTTAKVNEDPLGDLIAQKSKDSKVKEVISSRTQHSNSNNQEVTLVEDTKKLFGKIAEVTKSVKGSVENTTQAVVNSKEVKSVTNTVEDTTATVANNAEKGFKFVGNKVSDFLAKMEESSRDNPARNNNNNNYPN